MPGDSIQLSAAQVAAVAACAQATHAAAATPAPAVNANSPAPIDASAARSCVDMVVSPGIPDAIRQALVKRIVERPFSWRRAQQRLTHSAPAAAPAAARLQHSGYRGDDSYSPESGYDRPEEYDDGYERDDPEYSSIEEPPTYDREQPPRTTEKSRPLTTEKSHTSLMQTAAMSTGMAMATTHTTAMAHLLERFFQMLAGWSSAIGAAMLLTPELSTPL